MHSYRNLNGNNKETGYVGLGDLVTTDAMQAGKKFMHIYKRYLKNTQLVNSTQTLTLKKEEG